jgi:hypothetical protein
MALTGAGPVYDESYTSTGTITQYSAVKLSAFDVVGLSIGSSGTAAAVIGILQNDPAANGPATVRKFGLSKAIAGGTVSIGDPLTSTTDGRVQTAGTTGQYVFARACSASTAAGQYIQVFVNPGAIFMGSTA